MPGSAARYGGARAAEAGHLARHRGRSVFGALEHTPI
jgi:hypothetical protein